MAKIGIISELLAVFALLFSERINISSVKGL